MKKIIRKEYVTSSIPNQMHILIGTTRGELLTLADGDKRISSDKQGLASMTNMTALIDRRRPSDHEKKIKSITTKETRRGLISFLLCQ